MHTSGRRVLRALLAVLATTTLVAGLASTPAQAQRIRPTFWGMHDMDWTSHPAVRVGAANLTTSGTYWHEVERLPGVYDLDRIATQVQGAGRARPMLVLGGTPVFHTADPASASRSTMPRIDAWRDYVTAVVGRFGRRLDYQVWPEPNSPHNWTGSQAQMARLTAVASQVIRQAAPQAVVVGPAMTIRTPAQRRWMQRFYRERVDGRRVASYVDAVALNPFAHQAGSPEASYRLVRGARARLARIGVRKPLWVNEINYGVAGAGERTSTQYPVDQQSAYVVRTYALMAAAGVARTYWLGWFATDTMAVDLTDSSGRMAPPGRAWARVRGWLDAARFGGCAPGLRGLPARVWTCSLRKDGEQRRLYWAQRRDAVIEPPRSLTRVMDLDGGAHRLGDDRLLEVGQRPVLLHR